VGVPSSYMNNCIRPEVVALSHGLLHLPKLQQLITIAKGFCPLLNHSNIQPLTMAGEAEVTIGQR